jgi:hypothetical protein
MCVALAACAGTKPDGEVSVGSGGAGARAGVETEGGRARAGVSTSGPYAEADVIRAGRSSVSVGTGGVGARVGVGPVSVGVGSGRWWRLGLGL